MGTDVPGEFTLSVFILRPEDTESTVTEKSVSALNYAALHPI
jgi:hypothetical protein